MYDIFRLTIIAVLMVYFIGSFTYWLSNAANTSEDYENDNTFIKVHSLDKKQTYDKLITCCYFALTMLSTVGYGDLYPITQREMLFSVVVMLAGVTFFSYIMGVLFSIMTNYKQQIGVIDLREDLALWLLTL